MPVLSAIRALVLFCIVWGGGLVAVEATVPGVADHRQELVLAEGSEPADPVGAEIHADPLAGQHAEASAAGHHAGPALWSVLPFVLLLLCIAICPLAAPHFWHHHYPKVAFVLGLTTAIYYLAGLHDHISLIHVGFEYLSFIALLSSLFVAAGGIVINIDRKASPMINTGLLGFGAMIANIIGTTGAAMLLIRPFMRINAGRLRPYHIVFFIFIVANVGGALTPIGDPPLFLGFLKGIDFFQFFRLDVLPWMWGVGVLCTIFFLIDRRNRAAAPLDGGQTESGEIGVRGSSSFFFLALAVGAVFLDPNKFSWLPCVTITDHAHLGLGFGADIGDYDGHIVQGFSFIREIIQFSIAVLAFKLASPANLQANGFDFEPIKEVGYLFIGIFLTMVPALALIKAWAADPAHASLLTPTTLYFGTGALSGVLDNAPTFLSFLAGLEGEVHMTPGQISQMIDWSRMVPIDTHPIVLSYLQHLHHEAYFSAESLQQAALGLQQLLVQLEGGQLQAAAAALQGHGLPLDPAAVDIAHLRASILHLQQVPESLLTAHAADGDLIALSDELAACAVAAVFWGAFTYIGNGPNFMVKSIADSARDANGDKLVDCPSFFGYVIKFAIPFLLPMLIGTWIIFFSPWSIL